MSSAAKAMFKENVMPDQCNVALQYGWPKMAVLKKSAQCFSKASAMCMDQPDSHTAVIYGPSSGDETFKRNLANYLSAKYHSPVSESSLYVTAGATHGLHILSSLLFEAGDYVYTEDPSYYVAFKVFQDNKLHVKAVPMDEEGIVPSALEEAVVSNGTGRPLTAKKPYRGLIYLIPTFHNPTGRCYTPERCREVIEIARKHDLLIICDDVYNLLHFADVAPKRLFSFDNSSDPAYKGSVVSNGSFSKIFGPGLRLGWMEVPAKVIALFESSGVALSGGGFNHTVSCIMGTAIEQGFVEEIAEEFRQGLKAQGEGLLEALLKELPPGVSATCPQGGYFIWITLPSHVQSQDVLNECSEQYKITFRTGTGFTVNGDKYENCFRVSFSMYDVDTLQKAAKQIADVIKKHI